MKNIPAANAEVEECIRLAMLCDALHPADPLRALADTAIHVGGQVCDALPSDDPLYAWGQAAFGLPASPANVPAPRLLLDTLAGPRPGTLRPFYGVRYVVRWLLGVSRIHPEYTPRHIAAWTLGHIPLTPEHQAEAVPLLVNTVRGRRGREAAIQIVNVARGWTRGWLFFMAFYLVIAVLSAFSGLDTPVDAALFALRASLLSAMCATLFSPVFVSIALGQTARHRVRMRGAAARSLGLLAAPEGLGAVAVALADGVGETRQGAIAALPSIVGALTPAWYGQMPANTTRDICRAIRTVPLPAATHLQLIQALAVIGDGSAASDVEALLAGSPSLYEKSDLVRLVRSHLRDLLPLLQARRQQEQDNALLLRGSQQADGVQGQLLRASTGQNLPMPPEQLLRAAQNDDAP